ncbi:MAG: hypothetical protein L3J45_07385, partial [Flavobacteriaceae bacterium]|nr:hypothetical protein [Flavobacteriaceae bacterium]
MIKKSTFFVLLFVCSLTFSQSSTHIDFESALNGNNWIWTNFNGGSAVSIVANPSATGINTSSNVAKITILQLGDLWAGAWTSDIGTFNLTVSNAVVKMMVYKSVISDVHLKIETATGTNVEIAVANTVTNQWEELTFDFSSLVDLMSATKLVVMPDWRNTRTQDDIVYFDNVSFSTGTSPSAPNTAAPTPPSRVSSDVISIFSDAYTNVTGTDFNPNWGQSTVTSQILIGGNNTLKYAGLNYQGTQFTPQDATAMTHLHLDYWTTDGTSLDWYLINSLGGAGEKFVSIAPLVKDTWKSLDISLADYTNQTFSLADIFQFKAVGNGTFYLDNIYFYKQAVAGINDLDVTKFNVYPNPVGNQLKIKS